MQGISRSLRALRRNSPGFTLVEALLVTAITGFIMAGLFLVLSTGELSNTTSYSRVYSQAEARRITEWVSRDARLARTYDISAVANNPTDSHIKFYPVTGWDSVNKQYTLNPNYTEYTYDSAKHTVTRDIVDPAGLVLNSRVFEDVISAPFYTFDTSGNIIPLGAEIQQSRMLVISINVRKQTRAGVNIDSGITTEVRLRNG